MKTLNGQNYGKNQSVIISADVEKNPASITLKWKSDSTATSWTIARKLNSDKEWDTTLATNSANDTTYQDKNVQVGKNYEYAVVKYRDDTARGWGYINSGIEVPARHFRGRLALLIDSRFKDTLSTSIDQLKQDLEGTGWAVHLRYIDTGLLVTAVKDTIQNLRQKYPDELKTVFLLGHIPVPYAGNFYSSTIPRPPDGHTDHGGAWPADLYYGEFDGNWTDSQVNNTTSKFKRNHNVPGDKKWDQSAIQQVGSTVDLRIGRVDLSNLPALDTSEFELTRRYLRKNHNYRHGNVSIKHKGIIEDNFNFSEGFSQNGYKNFAPLMGIETPESGDYKNTLVNDSSFWSYGAGAGNMTSAGGVISTNDFVNDTFNGVFTMIFGSYFGDWDSENNLLRASLASKGNLLASAWAGRPHWYFHSMGMGTSLGYCTKLTQNNAQVSFNDNVLYNQGAYAGFNHVALMGDPTLTMYRFDPPNALVNNAPANHGYANLAWRPSRDSVAGYAIYRWNESLLRYKQINNQLITDTTYRDNNPVKDTHIYMVRAVKLQHTPSGSYYNLSQGVFDTADALLPMTSMSDNESPIQLSLHPNPSKGKFRVSWDSPDNEEEHRIQISNIQGQVLRTEEIEAGKRSRQLDLSDYPSGVYLLKFQMNDSVKTRRIILQ